MVGRQGLVAAARLGVGDALAGQRVRLQEGQHIGVVEPGEVLQPQQHAGHGLRWIARFRQHLFAGAVGVALVAARKTQGSVDGCGLSAHRQTLRGLILPRAGGGDGQQQRADAQQPVTAHLRQPLGDVTLGDVRHFMGENGGHLIVRLRVDDQPGVHPDPAAGQGKGVEAAVAQQKHAKVRGRFHLGGAPGSGREAVDDGLEVVAQQAVVQVVGLLPHFSHDDFAQTFFLYRRQAALRGVAQGRQAAGVAGGAGVSALRPDRRAGQYCAEQADGGLLADVAQAA